MLPFRLIPLVRSGRGGGGIDKVLGELELTPEESGGKLDFLFSTWAASMEKSFGDSYAFGIAGTGGTSSSLSAELF